MVDYTKSAATATKMLTKYGQTVTINQYAFGVEDPTTGIVAPGDPNTVTAKGVLLDFIYRTFGEEHQTGTMIEAADKRLLMSAGTAPTMKDTITVGSDTYRIVNIKQVNPAGTAVLFDLWLRR